MCGMNSFFYFVSKTANAPSPQQCPATTAPGVRGQQDFEYTEPASVPGNDGAGGARGVGDRGIESFGIAGGLDARTGSDFALSDGHGEGFGPTAARDEGKEGCERFELGGGDAPSLGGADATDPPERTDWGGKETARSKSCDSSVPLQQRSQVVGSGRQ